MALKGLDIFKLTPKTNCKKCGNPTCMAFAMKVAQGALTIDKCPDMSADALAQLSEASAPPMKTITIGSGDASYKLGGETVLFRHLKTFVSKNLYAVCVSDDDLGKLEELKKVDYVRIGERMFVELVNVAYNGNKDKFVDAVKKAHDTGRALILDVDDESAAKAALDVVKSAKPVLNGANSKNWEAFNKLAGEAGIALGVKGASIDEIYETAQKLEAAGNKNLIFDVTLSSIKDTFAAAVQLRRAALKDGDRSAGYPAIVNVGKLAKGDEYLETALSSLFTLKYGSIIVKSGMDYAAALPLYGLRQNIYTDPQKPMKVEPKVYQLNGADENSPCATTVDFALTYFVVSGEIERSGVPLNLIITDAGGYSVLTAWAAGKLSAPSIAKFFKDNDLDSKIKNKTLVLPGKVAVLKGELEELLPGWKVLIGPNEAAGLVKYLKDLAA